MRDILSDLQNALQHDQPVAYSVLVETRGSTPQKAGATMLVFPDGSQTGTLGGGCVEAEVKRKALQLLDQGEREILTFQLDGDYGWDDGLICGGRMSMLVDPVRPGDDRGYFEALNELIAADEGCTEAVIFDPEKAGGGSAADRYLLDHAGNVVATRTAEVGGQRSEVGRWRSEVGDRMLEVGAERSELGPQYTVLSTQYSVPAVGASSGTNPQSPIPDPQSPIRNPQSAIPSPQSAIRNPQSAIPPSLLQNLRDLKSRPRPYVAGGISYLPRLKRCRLVIVGGGHVGQKVAQLAADADFDIWVIDDREQYCNPDRFPFAKRLIVADIDAALSGLDLDESTFCIIVTRGHNHDEEALYHLAEKPAKYVGLIGSRRKIKLIFEDLLREGISAEALQRVHAPLGFDIGSQTVPEIAISIVAELIACRNLEDVPAKYRKESLLREVHGVQP